MYSIQRALNLDKLVKPGRALVLYGARQVGKTTLIQEFLKNYTSRYKIYTGEDISLQLLFNELKLSELDNLVNTLDLLVIDEALIITNLGKGIKLIIDRNPNLKVILTGSSSFELANHITEPLTGRKRTQSLLPISIKELKDHWGSFDLKNKLNELLIYGSYPEIITENSLGEKKEAIIEITNSYLFKDILSFLNLKKADLLFKLTKLLALQIGSEVNVNELSKNLQLDNKTVNHYLDILEKSFVIKLLPSFSNNQRSEIKKSKKVYFLDLGVRNALINQFQDLNLRNDYGALWENFVFNELYKTDAYKRSFKNFYFWRTHDQQEIDFILEADDQLEIIETKFSAHKKTNLPKKWQKFYPEHQDLKVINSANFLEYL